MKLTGKAAIFGASGTIIVGEASTDTPAANDDIDIKDTSNKVALEDSNGEEIGHAWMNIGTELTLNFVPVAASVSVAAVAELPVPPCKVALGGFKGSVNGEDVDGFYAYMGGGSIKEAKKGFTSISLPLIRKVGWNEAACDAFIAPVT